MRLFTRLFFVGSLIASMMLVASLPAWSGSKQVLSFAFSNGSPPYSYESNNKCRGVMYDLLHFVLEDELNYSLECTPLPWKRAQSMVRHNRMDGLATYPSKSRKQYAYFSSEPIFKQDFGYLVYNKSKPGIARINQVQNYADLSNFKFVGVIGVGWEKDNIPPEIARELAPTMKIAFNLLLKRQIGDFMVINPGQANVMASTYGFDSTQLGFARAEFISNSVVSYHVGLQKQLPDAEMIIGEIDSVLRSASFQAKSDQLMKAYNLAPRNSATVP